MSHTRSGLQSGTDFNLVSFCATADILHDPTEHWDFDEESKCWDTDAEEESTSMRLWMSRQSTKQPSASSLVANFFFFFEEWNFATGTRSREVSWVVVVVFLQLCHNVDFRVFKRQLLSASGVVGLKEF